MKSIRLKALQEVSAITIQDESIRIRKLQVLLSFKNLRDRKGANLRKRIKSRLTLRRNYRQLINSI